MERVRFFFDYKSPFSFLALQHTLRLSKEFNVKTEWLPFSFNMSEGFGTPGTRTEYQNIKLKYNPDNHFPFMCPDLTPTH